MEPLVEYYDDLPIPDYSEWRDSEAHHWMHPCHGPLPDLYGMVTCGDEVFEGAVWDTDNALFVFLCLKGDDPSTPMFSKIGWIPRTYRWTMCDGHLVCDDEVFEVPAWLEGPDWIGVHEEWMRAMLRVVLKESVRLALQQPMPPMPKMRFM